MRLPSLHGAVWLLISATVLTAVSGTPDHGSSKTPEAPPLRATTLLQAPWGAKMDSQSLRGKVVVLEFWATWCGPCIAAIPHLNALADKFKDEPVQFIAITAENEATVKKFLAKRPIHGWVALDTDKAMHRAYDVGALPHTVLLDKDGKVAASPEPGTALEQHIKDLLAGKPLGFVRTYPARERAEASSSVFGPVTERTLKMEGKECDFLVLHTGRVLRHSCVDGDISRTNPPTAFMQWVIDNGVDVGFCASTNDYRSPFGHGHLGLVALEAATYQFAFDPVPLERIPSFRSVADLLAYNAHHASPAENPLVGSLVGVTNIWNDLTPDQLLGPPGEEPACFLKEKRLMCYPSSGKPMPPIAFSTHDGVRGLLQVTDFTENPPSLKLRYKLVQEE